MTRRVWLPFDPALLGPTPAELQCERVVPDRQADEEEGLPPGADEVEFFVPDYRWGADLTVLARLPRLRVVQTLTAGVDHIQPLMPPGATLCNARGVHDTATAELAMTLMLAMLRGVPDFVRASQSGEWQAGFRPGLADRTVMILGYGAIGAALESRLMPFETTVLRVARTPRADVYGVADLPVLLPQADVVVVLVPLVESTRGLVDADFLARMRPDALLVNVSRGPVVDTDALLTALAAGRISAALDVVDPEPLPADHPLWSAPNLMISPHVGGASDAMWPRAYRLVAAQLARHAEGRPLANVVVGEY
jgi:phosphoglycerate dehydrogenase-like enzyme